MLKKKNKNKKWKSTGQYSAFFFCSRWFVMILLTFNDNWCVSPNSLLFQNWSSCQAKQSHRRHHCYYFGSKSNVNIDTNFQKKKKKDKIWKWKKLPFLAYLFTFWWWFCCFHRSRFYNFCIQLQLQFIGIQNSLFESEILYCFLPDIDSVNVTLLFYCVLDAFTEDVDSMHLFYDSI